MIKYEFNRNEFENALDFYSVIKDKMNLPEWFGNNTAALYDMLTGHIETPCKITLVGFNLEKENEINRYYLKYILDVFTDVEVEFPDEFEIIFKQ